MNEFQVVICQLGDESYGLDIGSVYEIIRFQESTAVPKAPSYVDGVINLRGRIIPVVDLSSRFGLDRSATTKSTRIIVAGTGAEGSARVGLVVDAVTEVLMLSRDSVEETPAVTQDDDSAYIKGIAKVRVEAKTEVKGDKRDQLVILLDLGVLLGDQIVKMAA
jgi:purine-binding chemotaxis protein CheW